MTGYGPPGDPSEQPTRRADLNARGYRPSDPPDSPLLTGTYAEVQAPEPESAPTPWYRKRAVLIAWGLLVLILIALIIYGLIDLSGRGHGGPTPTHTTTTTPTTTTTAPTTTGTTPGTTTEPPPSSAPPAVPAPPAPPSAGPPPQPRNPKRPHHLPKLPPTITLPGIPTVITLPPGL